MITVGSGAAVGIAAGPGGVMIPSAVENGNLSFAGQLQNPVVKVVEKYSYYQMSRDNNTLK